MTTMKRRRRSTKGRKYGRLTDLPGVKGERTPVHVRSVTEAVAFIRQGEDVTTAGDAGAITVWWDDENQLRGEFDRRLCPLSKQEFPSVAKAAAWLKEWWPRLGRD
jgi:hypothetical protein